VVKSLGTDRSHVAQPTEHLIGHRQSREKFLAVPPGVFGSGQDSSDVIAWMTGFSVYQITIIEVQVTNQCTVIKGCPIGRGFVPTNERDQRAPTKVFEMLSNQCHRTAFQHPDGAS